MRNLPLMLARLLLAAWVGAAALFVITGVREVTTKDVHLNQSPVKDALVAVRFPAYYTFGFTAVGGGLLATLLCGGSALPRGRRSTVIGLLVVALLAMLADYFWIYQPLLTMVAVPGAAKPAVFVGLHRSSMWINTVDVSLCLIAAVMICWPVSAEKPAKPQTMPK